MIKTTSFLLPMLLLLSACQPGKSDPEKQCDKDFQKYVANNYHNNKLSKLVVINPGLFDYYVQVYLKIASADADSSQKPAITLKLCSVVDFRNAVIYMELDSTNKIPYYENNRRIM